MKISNKAKNGTTDEFTLYDLRVEVVRCRGEMVCNHKIGDYFKVSGENLSIPAGKTFSIYALAALLPLLPAKQRLSHKNDWMTTDNEVACPDPNCGAIFQITKTKKRSFGHSDVSAISLTKNRSAFWSAKPDHRKQPKVVSNGRKLFVCEQKTPL